MKKKRQAWFLDSEKSPSRHHLARTHTPKKKSGRRRADVAVVSCWPWVRVRILGTPPFYWPPHSSSVPGCMAMAVVPIASLSSSLPPSLSFSLLHSPPHVPGLEKGSWFPSPSLFPCFSCWPAAHSPLRCGGGLRWLFPP